MMSFATVLILTCLQNLPIAAQNYSERFKKLKLVSCSKFFCLTKILSSHNRPAGSQLISATPSISSPEYQFLADLYNVTVGADWLWGQAPGVPWNFTDGSDPCLDEWEGLFCTPPLQDGFVHIETIYMPSYFMWGYLPESIGNLVYMQNLTLNDNSFTGGGFPDSIGQLRSLQLLNLEETYINGTIPESFGLLSELRVCNLNSNTLYGTIPALFCSLTNLTYLDLGNNLHSGSLPSCLGQLTSMRYFDLQVNHLNGTLPDSLGNWRDLQFMGLTNNHFSGMLPATLADLTQIEDLEVDGNRFTGTVPGWLGGLTRLWCLDLGSNNFNGTLPSALGNLTKLQTLYFRYNQLTGTIPLSFANHTLMVQIDFNNNMLSGPFPDYIGNFSALFWYIAFNNYLSGTIPEGVSQLTENFQEINVAANFMSGSIPSSSWNLSRMSIFVVSHNRMTGTVPESLFRLPALVVMELGENFFTGSFPDPDVDPDATYRMKLFSAGYNQFTGPLPRLLGAYTVVEDLNLTHNYFSGTMPHTLTELPLLNFLYVSGNLMTGTLPEGWDQLPKLIYLFLDNNLFRGPVPESLGQAQLLISLNLSSNHLSGTVPRTFSQLKQLEVLLLQDNALFGNLDGVFNASMQRNLTTIQLSDNQLTGTLPSALFELDKLQVVAAVSNCFTGSLPTSMCNSTTINTLALDGLQSASSCRRELLSKALDALVAKNLYSIADPLTGGVPRCLFQMPALTTLHLSGNGLTGTLPIHGEMYLTPTLIDLALSHNKLSGSIPAVLLSRRWANLDLSYNLLSYSLPKGAERRTHAINQSILLQENRLSGEIPSFLVDVKDVSLLESNLFSCNARRDDLPPSDPEYSKYTCGSDALNKSLYAWIAITSALLLLFVFLLWRSTRDSEGTAAAAILVTQKWWAASALAREAGEGLTMLNDYTQARAVIKVIVYIAGSSALWCVLVLMPLYIVMSEYYGTYSHQYAWALSAAYLSGTVPFALEFVFLFALPLVAFMTYRLASAWVFALANVAAQVTAATRRAVSLRRRMLLYVCYVLITFTIVLGVNIAYVVIALNQNGHILTLAQFVLALFKVAFNAAFSPSLMRWISHRVLQDSNSRDFVSVQLVVSLINNILIPCFVVSIINPSCFYYLFKEAPKVTSSYHYLGQCLSYDQEQKNYVECTTQLTVTATTSFDPPFAYSYQCSSSFITYYAPAYVIMCILAGFVTPLLQLTLAVLYRRATAGTRWFALLDLIVPRILKPVPTDVNVVPARDVFKLYFDAPQHITTLLTYLGLLLTFGAVFPPLAVCFFVTLAAIALFMRLKVGRFLHEARDTGMLGYIKVINDECVGAGNQVKLRRAVLTVLLFSCLFYTLFLFDTLGDAVGYKQAYWVIIVVPGIPLFILAVHQFEKKDQVSTTGNIKHSVDGAQSANMSICSIDTVEMTTRPSQMSTVESPLH